jgi:hypothetical protein
MLKKKVYSQEDLDKAVETYLWDIKLRGECKAFPNIPKRTISTTDKMKLRQKGLDLCQFSLWKLNLISRPCLLAASVKASLSPGMPNLSKVMNSFIQRLGALVKLVH